MIVLPHHHDERVRELVVRELVVLGAEESCCIPMGVKAQACLTRRGSTL